MSAQDRLRRQADRLIRRHGPLRIHLDLAIECPQCGWIGPLVVGAEPVTPCPDCGHLYARYVVDSF